MDLLIPIDRDSAITLRDQLYAGLRSAILTGRLSAGARLPATRVLARDLGLSRFTVDDAYARLIAEGFAAGKQGSGTFVLAAGATTAARSSPTATAEPIARGWSHWAAGLTPSADSGRRGSFAFSFEQGVPALEPFPLGTWLALHARVSRERSSEMLGYGRPRGFAPLREAIAGYLGRARMLTCDPDQIVITTGTQQAVDLLARLFVNPGDSVVIEDPGYPAARRVLAAAGATMIGVPVDGDGLRVDLLTSAAKLLYVTPAHQFPTGGVLSMSRRRALLGWAREHGTLIVEDDYDSEFRYGHRPVEPLAALDAATPGAGCVAYIGTFSKVLFPSLRLGYMVLPPDLVPRVLAAKDVADRHPPAIGQATVAELIREGHFERHIARMRRIYAGRFQAMHEALGRWFGNVATRDPASTAAGLHVLTWFDVPFDEAELVRRAAAEGVLVAPASPAYASPPARPGLLLGYAVMDEDGIDAGVRALARAALG